MEPAVPRNGDLEPIARHERLRGELDHVGDGSAVGLHVDHLHRPDAGELVEVDREAADVGRIGPAGYERRSVVFPGMGALGASGHRALAENLDASADRHFIGRLGSVHRLEDHREGRMVQGRHLSEDEVLSVEFRVPGPPAEQDDAEFGLGRGVPVAFLVGAEFVDGGGGDGKEEGNRRAGETEQAVSGGTVLHGAHRICFGGRLWRLRDGGRLRLLRGGTTDSSDPHSSTSDAGSPRKGVPFRESYRLNRLSERNSQTRSRKV